MASSEQLGIEFLTEARREMADCHRKIEHCIGQLTDEQLWWRPNEATNSIANLLLHLAGNVGQRIGSVVGGQPHDRDRDREFAERGPIAKAELRARLARSIALADSALAELAGEQLLEARSYRMLCGEVEATVLRIVLQTLVHLGGHTQEIIAMTRRQLGDAYRFMQTPSPPSPR
jgi:hypothetical protein